jgi:putative FmdB family regulatory protein
VRGILEAVTTYEYVCLACERVFEQKRSMTAAASVDTALACPSCGSDRLRRRFSFVASTPSGSGSSACVCGGACACGGR